MAVESLGSVEDAFGAENGAAEHEVVAAPKTTREVMYDNEGRQVGAQVIMPEPGMSLAEVELPEFDLSTVPTVEQRLAEAKMPVQVSSEQILGHDVLWAAWRPQSAIVPGDGTVTEGFFAIGKDLETGKAISIFIGGVALCQTLRNVKAPMVARIAQKGRKLVFQ